jgi:hypothetical protein
MPRIELIDVPLFGPNDPYHFEYDNIPLKNILRRQILINLSLDELVGQQRDAIGTQGSLANRLNQSINADGTLKVEAINSAEHSIESHTDSDIYVRMLRAESDKLTLISDNATDFSCEIIAEGSDDPVVFDSGVLRIIASESITWEITDTNNLKAHLGFPLESAHQHYYDITPENASTSDPDFINYKVNSSSTPFISGSLKVYVNGLRLTASASIYIPGHLVNDPWTLLTYTEDSSNGIFQLSTALSEEDIIRIDYDISYV